MTKLSIKKSNQWSIRRKRITLWLNDKKLEIPADKNFLELDLPAGEITVKASLYWTSSKIQKFILRGEGQQTIEVSCVIHYGWLEKLLSVAGLLVLFSSVMIYGEITTWIWGILIGLWVIRDLVLTKGKSFFYYLTYGRSEYLLLKEVQT
jgi:hypothetical protein